MLTDFHSHILPRMDDGSDSLRTSLAMLRMEADQGIRRVVATPHFYPRQETPEQFLVRRARAEERLRTAMEGREDMPELIMGAEVYFYRGISESEALPQLTIQGKSCILIEMPAPPWPEAAFRELEEIRVKRGILPILAHIDRYIGPFRDHGIPRQLERLPVLVQANASFFLDRVTGHMALRMLKNDRIHLLGSDCHDLAGRKPNLGSAAAKIRQKLGRGALLRIQENEKFLLND